MLDSLYNAQGERLDFSFAPAADGQRLVVLGHGVTGNKDRPFLVALAAALTAAGMGVLRFSFAGNGDSAGRFQESTITKEVADLGSVLDALGQQSICYVGHSMGGAVGVIRASQDRRITRLVSLAGMVHTRDFAQREFGDQIPDQGCMWDEPSCPLSTAYMDDMAQLRTIVALGAAIQVPWLLVHGDADDVVPLNDSRDICARAGDNALLKVLSGADHVFNGDSTKAMVRLVVDWLA